MSFEIILSDITTLEVDIIVNAANSDLLRGGGVCGAIFRVANNYQLQLECNQLAPVRTGQAVITRAYHLPSKYIIHAVGPIYSQYDEVTNKALLENAYKNSLNLALKYNCRSIAFPLLSSGIYGYPQKEALQIAITTIYEFLKEHKLEVKLVLFSLPLIELSRKIIQVYNYDILV